MNKEAQKVESMQRNFQVGWLDVLFPYHLLIGGEIDIDETAGLDGMSSIYTTLKYYNRQRALLLWMHHDKF